MNTTPTIKILVGYHKPAVLLKSDILVPIHVGRALAMQSSKDGEMSSEDYQWMLDNMIGDDTGDNISDLNRELCESTAIYWAWKNYEKIGNPEFIGFMHYRRILDFADKSVDLPIHNFLAIPFVNYSGETSAFLKSVDIYKAIRASKYIIGQHHKINPVLHFEAVDYLNVNDYYTAISILKDSCPQYSRYADTYNKEYKTYFCNLFILPKRDFFEYAEYLFKILFELNKKIDYTNYSMQQQRMPAYISEWLTGIFFTYLKSKHSILELPQIYVKNTELKPVIKVGSSDEVSIAMTCDENYAPYLAVTVQSIIENSNKENHYKIYILGKNLPKTHRCMFSGMQTNNILIEYVDISGYIHEYSESVWYTLRHFSEAAYFRMFIPKIFQNFKKVVYCDCDAVFMDDVAKLYDIDLDDKIIGAVHDVQVRKDLFLNDRYYSDVLRMKNPQNYFNSGLIIFDVEKCAKFNLSEKCMEALKEIKQPRLVDQDILNIVCEGETHYLDLTWNFENHLSLGNDDLQSVLPIKIYHAYLQSRSHPSFLHYSSSLKPWHDPVSYNADIFWRYARMTPFFAEIVYKNLKVQATRNSVQQGDQGVNAAIVRNIAEYDRNNSRYHRYKFLARLTFGALHRHYEKKKRLYEEKVRTVRRFLKSVS